MRPALALLLVVSASPAQARPVRPLFEPTNLEMEEPGVVDIDLQVGVVQSQGPARVVMPDFEIDLGIRPWIEIDLDGAYAIEGPQVGPFSFDHAAPDSLWLSAKLALPGGRDDARQRAWGLAAQLGPKLPSAAGSDGVGFEGLVLAGGVAGRWNVAVNLGGFVDPAPAPMAARPIALEAGLDLQVVLDPHFSILGELGAVSFASDDADQLVSTAGLQWSPSERLDVSIVGFVGYLAGNDQYGVLLGISPKFGR